MPENGSKSMDAQQGRPGRCGLRLPVRAVSVALVLAAGLVAYSLGAEASPQALASAGMSTARAETAQPPAAVGGPPANLENAGDWSMCLDVDSNHYPNGGDHAQLWSCNTHPEQEWRFDWPGPSLCATHDVPYMGTIFDGVAACGVPYNGSKSNNQGKITYNGVMLDSVGFQCVELAARYFYYVTGHNPPPGANGGAYAWAIYKAYPQYGISPGGASGGVTSYQSTLAAGDIISMWSSADPTGHVAIVTSTSLNSAGTGKIYVMDENANASGTDSITVTNGRMSFNGLNEFQWVYKLP
jgi:hypothetical protein